MSDIYQNFQKVDYQEAEGKSSLKFLVELQVDLN